MLRFESLENRLLLATVVLTPTKDATLIEFPLGNSNGAGNFVMAGRVGSNQNQSIRRAALAFDTSVVPAGATVTAASLELFVSRARSSTQSQTLHKLTADWGEGSSTGNGRGSPATAGGATWTHRFFPDVAWNDPGGDFVSTPSATATVTGSAIWTTWTSTQLTADVRGWLNNPATNFGWLLLGNESIPQTVTRFTSKDETRFPNAPRLIVTFDSITIDDVSVEEGDSGSTNAVFTVSLSRPFTSTVQVEYASADGAGIRAAKAPGDYLPVSGTVSFAPGDVSETITVQVVGDTEPELDEHFFVNLSNATGAPLGDSQGLGSIADSDGVLITWTGAADGSSWGNAGNWDQNRIPNLKDDIVVVPDVAATTIVNVVGNRTINRVVTEETLRIYGGTFTLSTATSSAGRIEVGRSGFGAGTLKIDGDGLSVNTVNQAGNVDGSGDLEVAGLYNWEFGQMIGTGTTFANGGVSFVGAVNKDLNGRTLVTGGTSTLVRLAAVRIGGLLRNAGTFEVVHHVGLQNLGNGSVINDGTFIKRVVGTGTSRINVPFTNHGIVEAQTGTLNFGTNLTNYNAGNNTLTGGTYKISTIMSLGGDITANAATIELDGSSATIQNSNFSSDALANLADNQAGGSLTIRGGRNLTTPAFDNAGDVTVGSGSTFTVNGNYTQSGGITMLQENGTLDPTGNTSINGGFLTGTGTIAADLNNGGTIKPGNPGGTLAIAGNFSQGTSGTLDLEMAAVPSLVPQPGFDQLSITGAASLGGTLIINSIGGFVPNLGDEFQVVSFASRTGAFAVENLNVGGGHIASTVLEPTRVIVRIDAPAASVTGVVLNDGRPNRSGLTNLTHQFSEPVTVGAASALQLRNHTTGATVDISGAPLQNNGSVAVTWNLTGIPLPDGNYTATLPKTVGLASTFSSQFHVLAGDSSGNQRVEFADFGQLASAFNTVNGPIYGPGDMNGDGNVSFADFGILAAGFNNILAAPTLDFGDAASPFPTVLPDGARHMLGSGLVLGAIVDAEEDGQPDAAATGDGADEDGVTFATLRAGTSAAVTVTATGPGTAMLNAWVDFNADGDWDDAGEQIFIDRALANGTNNLTAAIPSGASAGQVFARFRTSSVAGYSHSGLSLDGEVEDYLVTIVTAFARSPAPGSPVALLDFWTGPLADPSQTAITGSATSNVKPLQTKVVDLVIEEVASSPPRSPEIPRVDSLIDASLVAYLLDEKSNLPPRLNNSSDAEI